MWRHNNSQKWKRQTATNRNSSQFAVLVNRQYFLEDIYPKNIYFLSYSPKQKCSINLNLHLTLRIRQSISCPTNFLFHLLFMFLLKNTLRKHKAFSPELFSIETNRRVQTSQFPTFFKELIICLTHIYKEKACVKSHAGYNYPSLWKSSLVKKCIHQKVIHAWIERQMINSLN